MAEVKEVVRPLRLDRVDERLFLAAASTSSLPFAEWARRQLRLAAIAALGETHEAVVAHYERAGIPAPKRRKNARR